MQFLSQNLQRYLMVWLLVGSGLALWWPQLAGNGLAVDPFLDGGTSLAWIIALTMFSIGWMLPRDEVANVWRRWPAILGGVAVQYVTMPCLAFGIGRLMGLSGDTLVGVVMVGCVPGAMASNVLTLNAKGNVSFSVSLTTVATLVSPLVVPIILKLALIADDSVDTGILLNGSIRLLTQVVIPVIAGHAVGRWFSVYQDVSRQIGSIIANLAILWIIAVVVGMNREKLLGASNHFVPSIPTDLVITLVSINVGGYLSGFGCGCFLGLPAGMRRALTLEVGMQNAGLGAALASQLFRDHPEIAIPCALYTFGCMFSGTLLARYWSIMASSES